VVSCAKTAKLIEMPFGLWAWMGPRNHVLDMGPSTIYFLLLLKQILLELLSTSYKVENF